MSSDSQENVEDALPRPAARKHAKVPVIVIVDDDTDVLLALSKAISAAVPGAQVFPAESAQAALDFLQDRRADVVIADLRMPGLSGLQLADILGQSRKPPATILMTGHPSTGLAYRAINEHRFSAIFSKPFDPAVMVETVQRILSKTMGYRPARLPASTAFDRHDPVGRAIRRPPA